MKNSLHQLSLTLVLTLLSVSAIAAAFPGSAVNVTGGKYEGKTVVTPEVLTKGYSTTDPIHNSKGRNQNSKTDSTAAPTPMLKAIKPVTESEKGSELSKVKEGDESILSFNFLFYIIQKYKLQDIVD